MSLEELKQRAEMRPCPYCGGKVRGDKDVWCDCKMFAPRDRHQNAYCWKELDALREENEKLLLQLSRQKYEIRNLNILTKQNSELESLCDELAEALKKAHYELNAIRARDGVPYAHYGKSDVDPNYFSSVVDECSAALKKVAQMRGEK